MFADNNVYNYLKQDMMHSERDDLIQVLNSKIIQVILDFWEILL